jgi:hypothetical protein
MTQAIELFAGPELDEAVAVACGINVIRADGGLAFTDGGKPFCPSVDANTAFEAAEKIGLLQPSNNVTVWSIGPGYRIALDVENGFGVSRETLPTALCAAILRFASSR